MNKKILLLRKKFKQHKIDGYVIPINDDYFTEYAKINRLKTISNFSGSAGIAIILKNKNYLFTDGRYTIQSKIESGRDFKILSYEKIINCNLFRNLKLGIDPKLFTYNQIERFFKKNNKIKFIKNNLIDEIEQKKIYDKYPFFSLDTKTVGESHKSKKIDQIIYL
jgi:Xaa-Pro aminopeptidase